jgi:HEAT repeat protein
MRQSAATALGQLGEQLGAAALRERIVESLIAALEDEEEDVRRAAAKGLGQIGSQLKDTALRVRMTKSLIVALKGNYADEAVCQATAEALDKLDWHPSRSQAGAIYWIAKGQLDKCVEIGPPAVQPLIAAREYMDRDVRRAAAKALDELGWRSEQRVAAHFTRLQKTGG